MLSEAKKNRENPVKDTRRQQLIDATIACIHQFGLEQTTISRVTREASLSAGIVNFYFESKEKLLLGVLVSVRDEFHRQLVESVQIDAAPEEVLRRLIRVHFTPSLCSPQKIAVWHAFASASRTRGEYNQICGDLDARIADIVESRLDELCRREGLEHYDAPALARGLEGLLDGFWQDCLYHPDSFDPETAYSVSMRYLSSLFPAVFSREETSDAIANAGEGSAEVDLLPRWTYDNAEFFDLERDHLFRRHWMLAGHVSDLRNPRDFITFEGFGERAIVLRGNDGELRAFHNVCRHRGARLLEKKRGSCPHALSCPFHGWTYDLSGKLIGIPARDTFDNLVQEENSLVPVEMETWMGFVFIRFVPGGPSLAESMAPVESMVAPYRIDEMQPIPDSGYDELRPYNWKIIHDIDNEGYHVPVGHPSLQQLYGRTYRDFKIGDIPVSTATIEERKARNWSVRHYQKLLPAAEHLPEEFQRMWQYVGIFPNHVIGLYPESIEFYMTIPVTPDTTRYIGRRYALPGAGRAMRAARYLNLRINTQTEGEDESFVRAMQDGLRSSAFPEQQLSSREQGVRDFHESLQSVLPVAKLAAEPDQGEVAQINRALTGH